MSLTEDLANRREASRNAIPPEKLAAMDRATNELTLSGLVEAALKEGDTAPNFTLPNAVGRQVALSEHVKQGPVVVSFYRGGW